MLQSSAKRFRIPAGAVTAVVSLALWQLLTTVGPFSDISIPTATSTLTALFSLLQEGDTYKLIWETLVIAGLGLLIGVVLAIPFGVLLGLSRFTYLSSKFVFDFFKVIPPIVIIPIAILVLGPTTQMGVFLVIFSIFFALAIQTAYGVRDTDPILLETMRCYRLGLVPQIRFARLPSAAPFIAVGIRISAAAALVVSVVAGLIGGAPGLGRAILLSQSSGESEKTFALILILGILGIIVSRAVIKSQGKIIFWVQE